MELSIEILGYIAGLIGVSQNIPQVIKVFVTKEARSLSTITIFMTMTSAILWVIYGVIQDVTALIVTNVLFIFFMVVLLTLKLRYDNIPGN